MLFTQIKHFLSLQPTAEVQWPPPILSLHHESTLSEASGAKFWESVALGELRDNGFEQCEAKQVSFVAEKMVCAMRLATMQEVRDALADLEKTFRTRSTCWELCDEVVRQFGLVAAILNCDTAPLEEVSSAIAAAEGKDDDIVFGLASFPKGRTLLDEAKACRKERETLEKTLARAVDTCSKALGSMGGNGAAKPKRGSGTSVFPPDMIFLRTCNMLGAGDKLLGSKLTPTIAALHTTSLKTAVDAWTLACKTGFALWCDTLAQVIEQRCPAGIRKTIPSADWAVTKGLMQLMQMVSLVPEDQHKAVVPVADGCCKAASILLKACALEEVVSKRERVDDNSALALHGELRGFVLPDSFDAHFSAGFASRVQTFMQDELVIALGLRELMMSQLNFALAPQVEQILVGIKKHIPLDAEALPLDDARFLDTVLASDVLFEAEARLFRLERLANDFRDSQLAEQLGSILTLQRVLKPVAMLQRSVVNADGQAARITEALASAASETRVQLGLMENFTGTGRRDIAEIFESTDLAVHLRVLDKSISLKAAKVVDQIKGVLSECAVKWQSDLKELAELLEQWIPDGWLAAAADPQFLSNNGVLAALVSNPNYSQLHAGNGILNKMLAAHRIISKDGKGGFVDASILQKATSVHKNATDTVLCSYVVLVVMQTIPSVASPAGRKKEVQKLKVELGNRFKKLCEPLRVRIGQLESGEQTQALDFQKLITTVT